MVFRWFVREEVTGEEGVAWGGMRKEQTDGLGRGCVGEGDVEREEKI